MTPTSSRICCLGRSFIAVAMMAIGLAGAVGGDGPVPAKAAQKQPPADLHVAAGGKDSNPGTAEAPFATLAKARAAVRAKIKEGLTKDLVVEIRGGTYPVTETQTFGPEDSGTDKFSITYAAAPGEKVILNGGRKIAGWKKGANEIWTAEVPEVKDGKWYPRQLFVNGQRAIRARTPNQGWCTGNPATAIKQDSTDQKIDIKIKIAGGLDNWRNPEDIEIVSIRNNEGGRKRLQSVNKAPQTVTLRPPHQWADKVFSNDWFNGYPDGPCYLENAREFLDSPGEWYLDRTTGVLSYWPRQGEDLSASEVILPVVQTTLLDVKGTREHPVRNLHFRGLHLEHVDWPLPPHGYGGLFCNNVQFLRKNARPGHRYIDAAVEFCHARSCSFRDGGIRRVGAMGLVLREGTANITIEGNEIAHLGGGGIGGGGCNVCFDYLDAAPPPEPNEYQGYRIANNYVHHCGSDYFGAVGICMYISRNTVISHNLVHDIPYFGICYAADQNLKQPYSGDNVVEHNDVYRAMQVAIDGGAMYLTFRHLTGKGCLVRGNLVHDVDRSPHHLAGQLPAGGMIVDGRPSPTGKREYHFANNVVWGINNPVGSFATGFHRRQESTWTDNLFLNANPPQRFIEIRQGYAGLEPAYRQAILKNNAPRVDYHPLTENHPLGDNPGRIDAWSAGQFHRSPTGDGIVEVYRHEKATDQTATLKLHRLDPGTTYDLHAHVASYDDLKDAPGQPSVVHRWVGMAFKEVPVKDILAPGPQGADAAANWTGRQLMEQGLAVKTPANRMVLILYQPRKLEKK